MNRDLFMAMVSLLSFIAIITYFVVDGVSFVSESHNFDHFVFAQSWPQVVCFEGYKDKHRCHVSRNVTGWTIHGLWPTQKNSKGPYSCNKTNKFNKKAIEPLVTKLDVEWPNLYVDTDKYEFWEHEWSKHGTCAVSVLATSDEYRYFQKGLELYNQTNIFYAINYKPNDTHCYNITEILGRLRDKLKVDPVISCYKYKGINYIAAIEICFSKQFQMINCSKSIIQRHHTLYFKSLKDLSGTRDTIFDNINDIQDCSSNCVYYPVIKYQ